LRAIEARDRFGVPERAQARAAVKRLLSRLDERDEAAVR
jgi:hypothetical protein